MAKFYNFKLFSLAEERSGMDSMLTEFEVKIQSTFSTEL